MRAMAVAVEWGAGAAWAPMRAASVALSGPTTVRPDGPVFGGVERDKLRATVEPGPEALQVEVVAPRVEAGEERAGRVEGERVKARDADRRDAEGKREAPRGGDGDADAGEVPRPDPDADGVQVGQGRAARRKRLGQKRHEAFGLTLRHILVRLGQNPVAGQQSGRAMRGRRVEAEDQGVRR
jgi:hypothetical protein